MDKFWKSGDPYVWLTAGALCFSLLMVGGLILLVAVNGLGFFWPSDIARVELKNGQLYLGRITAREVIPDFEADKGAVEKSRLQLKIGNRDLYGLDFKWIDEADIASLTYPKNVVALERRQWGDFYGFVKELRVGGGGTPSAGAKNEWERLLTLVSSANDLHSRIKRIEKGDIGKINHEIERAHLGIKTVKAEGGEETEKGRAKIAKLEEKIKEQEALYAEKEAELKDLYRRANRNHLLMETVGGREKDVPVGAIVRAAMPNSMGVMDKAVYYAGRVGEFLFADPREANTEGGVFPAIFGTVMMVMLMSVAVLPLGVIAAVYLSEYAKQGILVQLVRISVNNLAGVPSIVFGVFGLGFFIYGIGGTLDKLFFSASLPTPTYGTGGILWASLTLALLTLPVVIVATEEGLAAVSKEIRHGSLALGATKFETLKKIVIPAAMPGILTGLILAISRATGEVAPLMITGVVKLAPALPVDGVFPYIHLERKFMHLGFQIYDVGFQSPNVEAAKPMVYATTLLLLLIVILLNIVAVIVRNRLRKRYALDAF